MRAFEDWHGTHQDIQRAVSLRAGCSRVALICRVTVGVSALLLLSCSDASDRRAPADSGVSLTLDLKTSVDGHAMALGRIGGIVASDDGTMFLTDVQTQEVVSIHPDGTQRGVFGGPGGGPGKFRGLRGTLAWVDSALYTLDWRSALVTRFDSSGAVTGTISWPNGRTYRSGFLAADTQLFGREVIFPPSAPAGQPRPAPTLRFVAFEGADIPQPLPIPPDSIAWPPSMDCEAPNGTIHILPIPMFDWFPREAFLPDGRLAVAHPDSLIIEILDPVVGRPVQRIGRDQPLIPLTDGRWEVLPEVIEYKAAQQEANGELWIPGNRSRECELPRPEHLRTIRALVTDETGRLWVETASDPGFVMHVFEPDGTLWGSAEMPPRDVRVPYYVRDGTLYMVTVDEFDVQSIDIYEVQASPSG